MNKPAKKAAKKSTAVGTKKSAPVAAQKAKAGSKKTISKKAKEQTPEMPDRIMGQAMHDISSIVELRDGARRPRQQTTDIKSSRKKAGIDKAGSTKNATAKKPATGKK